MLRRVRLAGIALVALALSAAPANHKTRAVIFVMTDGLRWQEVFRGADEALITKIRASPMWRLYGTSIGESRRRNGVRS
jgi:hypothetical protein